MRMRDAVALSLDDARADGIAANLVTPQGATAVQNPHQDEGSDNDADVAVAPQEIANLATRGVHVVVGPLRSNVARVDEAALATARSVAISGAAREPSDAGTRVFKLSPSDRQLAEAAYAWMRRHWGSRVCVLDDGTSKARNEAAAFVAIDPRAHRATLGRGGIDRCIRGTDAVYAAALEADPVFFTSETARRAPAAALVQAMSLRSFDPAAFAKAGKLWRAEPARIRRSIRIDSFADRYHSRTFVAASDSALRFYAATQIALTAAGTGGDPQTILRSRRFATILGTVSFTSRGEIRAPAIVVQPAN